MFDRKQLRENAIRVTPAELGGSMYKSTTYTIHVGDESREITDEITEEALATKKLEKWYNKNRFNRVIVCSRCETNGDTLIKISEGKYLHKECIKKT